MGSSLRRLRDHPIVGDWRFWGLAVMIALMTFGIVRGIRNDYASRVQVAELQQRLEHHTNH